MIRLRVAELCKERGIAHPYTALTKAGISVTKTLQYLSGKTNRLMLDDVQTLCTLLRCTPNDLLAWTPDKKADDYPENTLQAIKSRPAINLTEKLKTMSIAELRERLG